MEARRGACVVVAAALALGLGCGRSATSVPATGAGQGAAPAVAPTTSATTPPPIELRAPDEGWRVAAPEARAMFEAPGAPSATLAPPKAPPRVAERALENTAAGEARGATPITPLLGATLPEGGRASTTLTLPAGSCTTFIGQGGLGVIELDLFLTDTSDPPAILAADPDSGPIAVIGGSSGCFNAPFELSVELSVQVRKGTGATLVRAFAQKSTSTDAL